jgi:hypothetical protein
LDRLKVSASALAIFYQSRIAPVNIRVLWYQHYLALQRLKKQSSIRQIRIYALFFYGLGFQLIAVAQTNSVLAAIFQRARLLRFGVVRPLAIE